MARLDESPAAADMSNSSDPSLTSAVFDEIERGLESSDRRPLVVGICGAQGSGKSTLARCVVSMCEERGISVTALSLDDLYLTRAERERLARDIHPLLRTRGVPGTHDIALGLELLAALERGQPVALPGFDKGIDDRLPQSSWERAPAGCEVLVLEGWCVGVRPHVNASIESAHS